MHAALLPLPNDSSFYNLEFLNERLNYRRTKGLLLLHAAADSVESWLYFSQSLSWSWLSFDCQLRSRSPFSILQERRRHEKRRALNFNSTFLWSSKRFVNLSCKYYFLISFFLSLYYPFALWLLYPFLLFNVFIFVLQDYRFSIFLRHTRNHIYYVYSENIFPWSNVINTYVYTYNVIYTYVYMYICAYLCSPI